MGETEHEGRYGIGTEKETKSSTSTTSEKETKSPHLDNLETGKSRSSYSLQSATRREFVSEAKPRVFNRTRSCSFLLAKRHQIPNSFKGATQYPTFGV